ncbi:uncharacterized protein PAE49_021771 [Odontesthes bonariensis]|uniref:uncharacterized protein LOC142368455 n=1 Tax=Odontesthes bonariensis TaxID=219752 RepID=UPI003F583DA5
MGCRCCRMIKSHIYDPSVDVRKSDSAGSSLYQPHHFTGEPPSRDPHSSHSSQKQGLHNLGYSKSSDSTLKLEIDNNHVNHRLHAAPSRAKELHQQQGAPPAEGGLYIIQPDARWMEKGQSQVPVYPNIQEYENEGGHRAASNRWDSSITTSKSPSVDEVDEGVGGTPDYQCDTGDEGSVLSVDVHTSTTSLSSAGTRDELTQPKTPDISTEESGISVSKSEDEESVSNEKEEVQSVTDSMVAEALAALEAATAGEDFE